jgi:CRISPR system Cascade subunit CasE
LIWTLFGDAPDRKRDFLWREGRPGEFYILSARKPIDAHALFECDEPRDFAPALETGQRLSFVLRVNATVARSSGPGQRGKKCDIVMDSIRSTAPGHRATARKERLVPVASRWLAAQGAKSGFTVPSINADDDAAARCGSVQVNGYHVTDIQRERRSAPLSIGILDLEGVLEVREPDTFVSAIVGGFGRAKAFGCGLMLIKRA